MTNEDFLKVKAQVCAQPIQMFIDDDRDPAIIKRISPEITLADFITRILFELNTEYSSGTSIENIETEPNCYRSIGDMYALTRFYFPECTFEQYCKNFYSKIDLDLGDEGQYYYGQYCNDIQKQVYKQNHNMSKWATLCRVEDEEEDEYGHSIREWVEYTENMKV